VTRHSSAARGFHPRPTPDASPKLGWRSVRCLQIGWTTSLVSTPPRLTRARGRRRPQRRGRVWGNIAASSAGYREALALGEEHAPGRRVFAVDGTDSFGAGLTRFLTGCGRAGDRGRPAGAGIAGVSGRPRRRGQRQASRSLPATRPADHGPGAAPKRASAAEQGAAAAKPRSNTTRRPPRSRAARQPARAAQ